MLVLVWAVQPPKHTHAQRTCWHAPLSCHTTVELPPPAAWPPERPPCHPCWRSPGATTCPPCTRSSLTPGAAGPSTPLKPPARAPLPPSPCVPRDPGCICAASRRSRLMGVGPRARSEGSCGSSMRTGASTTGCCCCCWPGPALPPPLAPCACPARASCPPPTPPLPLPSDPTPLPAPSLLPSGACSFGTGGAAPEPGAPAASACL